MFTLYIHILEVLARNIDGADVGKIADMSGGLMTILKAKSYLRDLQLQGFVKQDETNLNVWHITEKALEYTWTVNNARDLAQKEKEAIEMHEKRKSEAEKETDVFDAPQTTFVEMIDYEVSFPLYGNLTIDEVVTTYEQNAPVIVKSASLEGDTVTLKFDPIPHDDMLDDKPIDGNYAYHHSAGYWNEYGEFVYFNEE